MAVDLFEVSLIFAGIAIVAYGIYKFFYLPKQAKLAGNAIRILLFEQIGKDIVFLRVSIGEEMPDDTLGVYIRIGKNDKKVISDVSNNDLFYDSDYGKCLMVVKYADDDYRVMARLNNAEWYRRVDEIRELVDKNGDPLVEEIEVINPDTGDKELFTVPKTEVVSVEKFYAAPVGISQEGREVMRFNREWHKRMAERRKEKENFWEKYGTYIMLGSMMIIILISTAYNSNKFEEASNNIAAVFDDRMGAAIDAANSPQSIERLFEFFQRRDFESQAPPT